MTFRLQSSGPTTYDASTVCTYIHLASVLSAQCPPKSILKSRRAMGWCSKTRIYLGMSTYENQNKFWDRKMGGGNVGVIVEPIGSLRRIPKNPWNKRE